MTKRELIETILLNIHGGNPSVDVSVYRVDIEMYLPIAIRDGIVSFIRSNRNEVKDEIRMYGSAGSGFLDTSSFLTRQKVTPAQDVESGRYYIDLPKKVMALPLDRGVNDVFPVKGDWDYIRVVSQKEIIGLPRTTVFYWHENQRIWFENLGLPICDHYVRFVVDPESIGLDDDLFLPSGVETEVVNSIIAYFTGQRQLPEDERPNEVDDGTRTNT